MWLALQAQNVRGPRRERRGQGVARTVNVPDVDRGRHAPEPAVVAFMYRPRPAGVEMAAVNQSLIQTQPSVPEEGPVPGRPLLA